MAHRKRPPTIILASASPRRRELLTAVGFRIQVHAVSLDESPRPGESASALSRRLARAKARTAAARFPGRPVLGADTVVVVRRRILGKPRGAAEARTMLRRLSGRWHEVVTNVVLIAPTGRTLAAESRTRVRFSRLTSAEIARYANGTEPRDKAGAYALQGAAAWFVAKIQGSASNVIGLPLEQVRRLVARARLPAPTLAPRCERRPAD